MIDPHQVAIHRRLQLVGPEVADFFHDCCSIMAGAAELRSRTHLVAHLLREIDGRLRDVLEPLFDEKGRTRIEEASKEKQTHRAEIAESFETGKCTEGSCARSPRQLSHGRPLQSAS